MTAISKHWRIQSLDEKLLEVAFETIPTDMRDTLLLFRHGCSPLGGATEQDEEQYRSRCREARVAPYSGLKVEYCGGIFVPTAGSIYSLDTGHFSCIGDITNRIIHGDRFYELQFEQDDERGGGLPLVREQHWPLLKKDGYKLYFGAVKIHHGYRENSSVMIKYYGGNYEVDLEITEKAVTDSALELISWHQGLQKQFSE
jgi:hypothetical protein